MSGGPSTVTILPTSTSTTSTNPAKDEQTAIQSTQSSAGQNMNNRGGGTAGGGLGQGKRKRGGPNGGVSRNTNMGGRGGFHPGFVERRTIGPGDFDGPMNKKSKIQNPEFRIFEKLRSIQGPTIDLPQSRYELKKFLANTRLYIGNIPPEVTEAEIKELFLGYGEVDEVFINREKNFAFLKLDYRTNAERARAELDQHHLKNRIIKVRFAPATVRIKVKNLGPMVSNELLELAFGIFGDIERALVFVDEKGKSTGEGLVEFTRKNNAALAHKFCTDKCYFITSDLRPVITEMGDMSEMDEGMLEMNLPKQNFKRGDADYHKSRQTGPRIAAEGFEVEYGEKWKALVQEYKAKENALKEELQKEIDQLHTKMEMARYDYETEMLRQQLRQRELDQERHKIEMQRMPPRNFGGGGGGPFPNGSGPGGRGLVDPPPPMIVKMDGPEGTGEGNSTVTGGAFPFDQGVAAANSMPLIPPPMPPAGLMTHLQGEQGAGNGPTWEYPERVFPGIPGRGILKRTLDKNETGNGFSGRMVPRPSSEYPKESLVPNPMAIRRIQATYNDEDNIGLIGNESDDDILMLNDSDPVRHRQISEPQGSQMNHPYEFRPAAQSVEAHSIFDYVPPRNQPLKRSQQNVSFIDRPYPRLDEATMDTNNESLFYRRGNDSLDSLLRSRRYNVRQSVVPDSYRRQEIEEDEYYNDCDDRIREDDHEFENDEEYTVNDLANTLYTGYGTLPRIRTSPPINRLPHWDIPSIIAEEASSGRVFRKPLNDRSSLKALPKRNQRYNIDDLY